MVGYEASSVLVDRLCLGFHEALARGGDAVNRFFEGSPEVGVKMWWGALLEDKEEAKRWRRLFETSRHFQVPPPLLALKFAISVYYSAHMRYVGRMRH